MAQSISHKGYFSITDLVKELSIDKDLVHHYESKGLVSAKPTKRNQRVYSRFDKIRLKFITRARHADYSLKEIESLIGRITPHLTESDEVEESLLFAEKKFNALREQIKALDPLEQINITCDLELLSGYIIGLNTLNAKKHLDHHTKKQHQEKKSLSPQIAEQSKEPSYKKNLNHDTTFDVLSMQSKKPYIIGAVLISALLAVFLIINSNFFGTKNTPNVTKTPFADKYDGQQGQSEVLEDGIVESHSDSNVGDMALNSNRPHTEGADNAILPLERAQADTSIPEQPQAEPSDIDAPGPDPSDSFANTQTDIQPREAPELELMKKVIKDMAAKYSAQSREDGMPATVVEKDGGEDPDLQSDSGGSDASVVASVASMTAVQQKVPKKKSASGLTGSDTTVTDTQPKTSKKKETRATTNKQQSQKASAVGSAVSDSKGQKAQKKVPANNEKQQRTGKRDTPPKISANQLAKAPSKSEPSEDLPSRTMAAIDSGSEAEASKKASNSAAREWIRTSRQSREAGDASETIVSATVAISLDPDLVSPYLDRAWAYTRKGLYEKAIDDTSKAIDIEPNSAAAYMTRAEAYKAVGQTSKARAAYEKACKLGAEAACTQKQTLTGGDSVEGLLRQSRQDLKKRDWNAVIATSSDVLKVDPDNVIAYINRSAAFLQKGAFQQAIADCNKALNIDPGYSLAFNNRGYAYERLGKLDNAEQDYKKACSLGLKLGCKNYEKF